ncbi:collagen alpha-1(I) chain-like [Myotis myotis]|uniref:collagen alpha-1(I) chain-like n=1 Tax=Myotis myotis TaxID=51298 RepID=UPI00174BB34D|nr:collagen alpha-1(I) chain-like [Myotis myotis]
MGGAAKKWRPGRGRRPGWGAQAGGVDEGADGVRGPGGSGGPGGGGRAAAAALIAAPGASGLGLRPRGPDASRSSLRLCCNCLCRCCLRRCCSCCHSPRPEPGRRQLRTRPWPPLHLREGVARLRGGGRAGGQRGHSRQAPEKRSRPPRRQPPATRAADSAFTLMLGGVPEPGGARLPAPSPPTGALGLGDPRPDVPALCDGSVTTAALDTSQIRGEAGRPGVPNPEREPPRKPASAAWVLPGSLRGTRGPGAPPPGGVPLSNLTPLPNRLSSAESSCPGFLKGFKLFL